MIRLITLATTLIFSLDDKLFLFFILLTCLNFVPITASKIQKIQVFALSKKIKPQTITSVLLFIAYLLKWSKNKTSYPLCFGVPGILLAGNFLEDLDQYPTRRTLECDRHTSFEGEIYFINLNPRNLRYSLQIKNIWTDLIKAFCDVIRSNFWTIWPQFQVRGKPFRAAQISIPASTATSLLLSECISSYTFPLLE